MKKIALSLLLFLNSEIQTSEVPNFYNLEETAGSLIFLSSERSGTNLLLGSLSAVTHKPISWLNWGYKVFEAGSRFKKHPSYNRLGLPLISEKPLLYRSHYEFEKIKKIPSDKNRLIFLTRNPKELIFRAVRVQNTEAFDFSFVETFLSQYLEAFEIYNSWDPLNRYLVFYEDFIRSRDEILLSLLDFMEEEPLFFDDYQAHREEYLNKLLNSYKAQHSKAGGGASVTDGPEELYYTKNVPIELLLQIDTYIEEKSPVIWEKYLKRFETK